MHKARIILEKGLFSTFMPIIDIVIEKMEFR